MLILAFVHPVAPGHDDLNSSRYQSAICVWMSYLQEEGGGKHGNACAAVAVVESDRPKRILQKWFGSHDG